MEVFSSLGIDWKLLFAQLLNFLVLLGLLYKFLYHPVVKLLESREKRVKESIEKAAEIDVKLKNLSHKERNILFRAKREAETIINHGREDARAESERIRAKTHGDVTRLVTDAKATIAAEKERSLRELKKDVADLVILTSSRALGGDAMESVDKRLVEETIEGL